MSSSPSQSPAVRVATEQNPVPEYKPFPYTLIPEGARPRESMITGFAEAGLRCSSADGTSADSAAAREGQARNEGRQQGQAEARNIFEDQLSRERASLAAALAQFTRDRAKYFQAVEAEVVQLALSIARKILHREAQLDPLLLAGIVRVALEKIDGGTGIVLRVHPQNASDWRRYLSTHLEPSDLPEIVEDSWQPPDQCTLKTSMSTAVLGLEVQLKEIEQGLMDLLSARPGAAS